MTDSPARTYAEHLASSSPLTAAALAFGDMVEEVDARRAAIQIHHFDTTEDARVAASHDELADGDVIVVKREKVVGFLVVACLAVLTEDKGVLPHLPRPGREYSGGTYVDSVIVAEREAHAHGFLLRDESEADRLRAMHRQAREEGKRVASTPDPNDPEWNAALDRMTVAVLYLRENDPVYRAQTDTAQRQLSRELAHRNA